MPRRAARACLDCRRLFVGPGQRCPTCAAARARAHEQQRAQRRTDEDAAVRRLRGTRRWKTLRARLIADAERCELCGLPFDRDTPHGRRAPSVDHITPLAQGGDPYDEDNLRVVHIGCNSRRAAQAWRPRTPPDRFGGFA